MLGIRTASVGWGVLVSAALIVGSAPCSSAQEIAPVGQYREGIPIGLWKVFPSIFAGALYDTNPSQLTSNNEPNSGVSARVVPNLLGVYNTGKVITTLYGTADARFFDTNTVAATAGFTNYYQPTPDWVLSTQGNYTRQTDVFNSALNFNNGAIGPSTTAGSSAPLFINPFGTTPGVNPIAYNQFTGSEAITKKFGYDNRGFVTLSGTVYYIAFDHQDNLPANDFLSTSHDGYNYYLSGRVGYHVVPAVYVFAESDGILQRFNNSLFNTNGYRVVGGVGSDDPRSLLTGEIYGGYQTQSQVSQVNPDVINLGVPAGVNSGIPQNVDSSVFGGRIYYFPTRRWSLVAQVDETLGVSTLLQPTVPAGTPTRTLTSLLQTNYAISYVLSVGARLGYTRSTFFGIDRLDNGYLAGASLNYEVWRNLMLTLDYQYSTVRSDAPLSDFTRNVYTVGLTYKY